MRITQFLPAVSRGDGVTAGALLYQRLLTELGHEASIVAGQGAELLTDTVVPYSSAEALDACSDLILVHHSMGHDFVDAIESTNKPKILVYHNITPATMFSHDSGEARYSELGRKQLFDWRWQFDYAVADSEYNAKELIDVGYKTAEVLPVLVDPQRFNTVRPMKPDLLRGVSSYLLTVGRIAENKRQDILVDAIALWSEVELECPTLVLSGAVTSPSYLELIWEKVLKSGLESKVIFLGRTTEEELAWLYKNASALWCASEHEGFCMPLLEAAHHQLPVISSASTNIPSTLGASGLMLKQITPQKLVATTRVVLQDIALRKQLIEAGELNLERFSIPRLRHQISEFLARLTVV